MKLRFLSSTVALAATFTLASGVMAADKSVLLYFAPVAGYLPVDHVQFNIFTPPANSFQPTGVTFPVGDWSELVQTPTFAIAEGTPPVLGYQQVDFHLTDPLAYDSGSFYIIADGFLGGQYVASTYWEFLDTNNQINTGSWHKSVAPDFTPVPEPSSLMALLMSGVGVVGLLGKKRS